MSRRPPRLATVAALLAAIALTPIAGSEASAGVAGPTPERAAELGRRAWIYGFPLLEFARVRKEQTSVACPDRRGNAPLNSFSNAPTFPSPESRTVVAPNTDTLYSIAHLDLGHGPIVLGHPGMGRRYFSLQLLDPYTNVIGFIGSRATGPKAGRFAIAWREKPARTKPRMPVIESRYRRVWVIGRTLATDRADQREAYRRMRRYELHRLGREPRRFPARCNPGEPGEFPTPTDGERFIAKLNRKLASNPPPRRDRPLLDELASVGVGPGLDPERAGLSPAALNALYASVAAEAASFPTATRLAALQQAIAEGGWLLPADNIGDYGTDYEFRARIAILGLGANTPDEAIYPTALTDSAGALLDGANDYRVTFPPGEAPPARYFWSLTAYDSSGFLAPNPIDRYSVGPSHPPLREKADGSIVIALQDEKPAESRVNWLPTPAAGFRLNLRLYGPSRAARRGDWRPPPVVEVTP
ncbi:MAG: DUF1214 domain-containing protein [Thermoleophilia bacterium]|nr:DUF1214 domain-containing protein [Thermoleophilia bacterium]GIK77878.1 MAG: hypothetical protein BroJett022_15680 [Actinomycetes bacterium]